MNDLYKIHHKFNVWCAKAGIATELVISEDDLKGILVFGEIPNRVLQVLKKASPRVCVQQQQIQSGPLVILASQSAKSRIGSVIAETNYRLGALYGKLGATLSESEIIAPALNSDLTSEFKYCSEPIQSFDNQLMEALSGIAVPDGSVQPQEGIKMLETALDTKTRLGVTLKDALKKQGVTWSKMEPGSHVVVFSKDGDEKWRVEPITMSDKKVFEQTVEALWSVANGKAPNARTLERDAAQQKAQELRDNQKEVSDMVDQIVSKYAPEPEQVVPGKR